MSTEQTGALIIPKSKGKLAKALAEARLAVPWYVTKGGFNAHQRYPFVGHPDVMAHPGRTILAQHGLVLLQTLVEYVSLIEGGKQAIMLWKGRYKLIHDSGESVTIKLQATTGLNDKSAFVASTALDRTAWLRTLAIAGSDDEDPDHTGQQTQQNGQPQQPDPKADQAQRVADKRDAPPLSASVLEMIKRLDTATTRDEAVKALNEALVMHKKVPDFEKAAITHHANQCMNTHKIERNKSEART